MKKKIVRFKNKKLYKIRAELVLPVTLGALFEREEIHAISFKRNGKIGFLSRAMKRNGYYEVEGILDINTVARNNIIKDFLKNEKNSEQLKIYIDVPDENLMAISNMLFFKNIKLTQLLEKEI